jgi:putative ABC transport system permease protein
VTWGPSSTWKSYAPDHPFTYHFLDDEYNVLYKSESRIGHLFSLFTVIAIVLGCLGLFALTAYTTAQRIKEIGIRKLLGASVLNIVTLLSIDFLKLVVIALLIAFPLSWYAMHRWLQDFAYRVEISWIVFFLAAMISLLVAWLTLSFQSIKAALTNPVTSLKVE